MDKMKIEIWSDIACPYCYIGKRKLEKALEQFSNRDNVELVWHSYELDPALPANALNVSIYTYFARKYEMNESQARETQDKVAALAKEVGLNYNFDKLIVANTSNALRLIKLAAGFGLATEAEEVLFDAYFVCGKDISNCQVLIDLGVSIGLKKDNVIEMLDSNNYLDDIKKDIQYAENELKLEYIPFYRFNNRQMVEGSIPVERYLEVLQEAYSEWKQGVVSSSGNEEIICGQSCSIDGICS